MSHQVGQVEFEALRATIRERGTLRVTLAWLTLAVWAALALVLQITTNLPILSLVPLVVLVAGFEAVNALHVTVERIGRYLQVFYEERLGERLWETTAMAYGRQNSGGGPDPLFSSIFVIAALVNFLPVALAGVPQELLGLGAAHLLLPARVLLARYRAAGQRAQDLERFRRLAASDRAP